MRGLRALLGSWFLCASAMACTGSSAPAPQVRIAVDDGSPWHVHPPGKSFDVELRRTGGGTAKVFAHWVDSRGTELGDPIELPARRTVTTSSPSSRIGYFGLVFSSPDRRISFPPQPAGFPSEEYGFAILPAAPALGPPEDNVGSPFGIVHADALVDGSFDPYLRGQHVKTLTWNTVAAEDWARAIAERSAADLVELPILADDDWDSDGHRPISTSALDRLAKRFRRYAEAAPVSDWELGVEENYENRYGTEPHYLANLAKKAQRVRTELRAVRPNGRLVYNLEGFDAIDWERLANSDAMPFLDVLSTHPYRWNDFEAPETWLGEHIESLREILRARGHPNTELWITEIGVPVRGNNDPDGFFGYPVRPGADHGTRVPGVTRDYAAVYTVKYHVVALAAKVGRIYAYNYQNRGHSIRAAEDHFGLRGYRADGSPGFPLPAYVAYATMLRQLNGKAFVERRQPRAGVWLYEFAGSNRRTALVWTEPAAQQVLRWDEAFPGRTQPADAITTLYGTPVPSKTSGLAIDGHPIWVTIDN